MVIVQYVMEKEKKTVSDNTIAAEGLSNLFRNLAEKGPNISIRMAKNVSNIPEEPWFLQKTLLVRLLLETPKAVLSVLPEVINFHHT